MVNFKSRVIAFSEMSIMVSLAFILHSFFKILEMPNGGSVNFGLTPLIIFSFRRNLLMGTISGFVLSIVYFLSHPYIPPTDDLTKIIFGVSLVHIIRFLLFCTSGITVWCVNTPFGDSAVKYVFIYNLAYCLPNFIADLLMCITLQKFCFGLQNKNSNV